MGKSKTEIIAILGNNYLDSTKNYIIYTFTNFYFFKKDLYIFFDKDGLAEKVIVV